jgi:hypothetical protein
MPETDEHMPEGASREDEAQRAGENSFSHLTANPTVKGWKRMLYTLVEGGGGETLYRLGSVEQYVRVLLAETKDKSAHYCFREALSELVQEWTPTLVEPADKLHRILSLLAAFTPGPGFSKTLNYLDRTEGAKRSAEWVAREGRKVDLYHKGMVALSRYYPAPPAHSQSDYGFLAYKQLLEKNLKDPRYSGYAVVRLLQLKALDIQSEQFSSLLLASDEVARDVVRYLTGLADRPGERRWVEESLGNVLVTYARADNIEKFKSITSELGMRFDPECDYEVFFPTLTFADGSVLAIYLDMEEVKDTALSHYKRHSRAKLPVLLAPDAIDEEKIAKYVSGYVTQVVRQHDALNALVGDLRREKATITFADNRCVLTIGEGDDVKVIPLRLKDDDTFELMKWHFRNLSATG